RMKGDLDAVDGDALAEGNGLAALGDVLAVAHRHDAERFLGGHDRAVAGARVVGAAVRDKCTWHRAHGVDVNVRRRAVEALRCRADKVLGAHGSEFGGEALPDQRMSCGDGCTSFTMLLRPSVTFRRYSGQRERVWNVPCNGNSKAS